MDNKPQLIKMLSQKRGISFRNFQLFSDKVLVETRTLRKIEKFEVKLEDTGFDILYQADNVIIGKIWFYICLLAPFILDIIQVFPSQNASLSDLILIHIGCWIFALFNYLKQHQDDIILKGKENLIFYRKFPNEQTTLEFIEQVKKTKKEHLKLKYYNSDNYLTETDITYTMNWLYDLEIISKQEYNSIIEEFNLNN